MTREPGPLSSPKSTTASMASASHQRNVGVLEVKMRHRLQEDRNAVAVGVLRRAGKAQGGRRRAKKPPRLPSLASKSEPLLATRPISFETERQHVMTELQLPSPTRSVVDRHVQHTKHNSQLAHESLPPVAGAFKKRGAPASMFPQAYARNELPIMIEGAKGDSTGLRWTAPLDELDFGKYFPLFVDGMREKAYPFSFLAREGAFQLVAFAQRHPPKLLECLHRVIPALRTNLEMRDDGALRDALLLLQQISQVAGIGPLLVPYYRQLLPVLNMFKSKRRNLGDAMDFRQKRAQDLGEVIIETLELLERTGGEDAYINIKYMVPAYETALG
ncbi:hypothetical protein BBJ28_00017809 [Nothophytophthora sp. Chile5]|nr:hypothetical protein BBJ28_00017809 [Nothophytophthora sp. Chile5]